MNRISGSRKANSLAFSFSFSLSSSLTVVVTSMGHRDRNVWLDKLEYMGKRILFNLEEEE